MRDQIDALKAEFEAMPFAARVAGAGYAARVFALLDSMQCQIDRLRAGGLPSVQTLKGGHNGASTNRDVQMLESTMREGSPR